MINNFTNLKETARRTYQRSVRLARRALRPLVNTDIEPNRAVERGVLIYQNPGQVKNKIFPVFFGSEVSVLPTPSPDGLSHPVHHLLGALFSFRRIKPAPKIF